MRHSPLEESKRLAEKVEQGRRHLIETEMMLAETFCELATTESCAAHWIRVKELAADARQAMRVTHHCLGKTKPWHEKESIEQRMQEVSARLNNLERMTPGARPAGTEP